MEQQGRADNPPKYLNSMNTYTYHRKKVNLVTREYASNKALAIAMCNMKGEVLDVISVNIPDGMANDSMTYLDTNNYPDIGEWMEKNGLAIPMYYEARSGFCIYPLYTILTSKF